MRVNEMKAAVGGSIGFPSKMPGTSYGIPAQACKTGGKLHAVEGTTCSNCYALKGNYIYPSVKTAQANRLASINNPAWTQAMINILRYSHKRGVNKQGEPIAAGWHRWHDAGDIQSEEHLGKIVEVARGTPEIRHWLPTRELSMLLSYIRKGGTIPDNLTVRVSDTMVDGKATKAWPITSGVHTFEQWFSPLTGDELPAAYVCPAPKQEGKCGDCRACWDHDVARTTYHEH